MLESEVVKSVLKADADLNVLLKKLAYASPSPTVTLYYNVISSAQKAYYNYIMLLQERSNEFERRYLEEVPRKSDNVSFDYFKRTY